MQQPVENLDSKIKEIWPKDGPSSGEVYKYLKKYRDEKIIIKCGGSVLLDSNLFDLFCLDLMPTMLTLNMPSSKNK